MLGGASKSNLWPSIIADITGATIKISEAEDMACIGAAILAGKGAGLYKTEEEGYRKLIKKEKEILPNTNNLLKYSRLFDEYKQRFNLLKKLYSN